MITKPMVLSQWDAHTIITCTRKRKFIFTGHENLMYFGITLFL